MFPRELAMRSEGLGRGRKSGEPGAADEKGHEDLENRQACPGHAAVLLPHRAG
jgi:hypothetical protein